MIAVWVEVVTVGVQSLHVDVASVTIGILFATVVAIGDTDVATVI